MPATAAIFLIVMFTGFFAMIFGVVYLTTRQNLAMIEKGMNPKLQNRRSVPFRTLKLGLLLMGAGIGLLLAFFIDTNMPPRGNFHQDDAKAAIYFALIAIGGGLGLITSYVIERKYLLDRKEDSPL